MARRSSMRCDDAQRELGEGRYGADAHDGSPELRAHLAECAACRALATQHVELDRILALDQPVAPRPGFDTRFLARLADEKARPRAQRRRWFWMLVPLATGALSMLLLRSPPAPTE